MEQTKMFNQSGTAYYPSQDITMFRHKNNPFSAEANKSIKSSKADLRNKILAHIREAGEHGYTSEEISIELEIPLQTVSGRMSELKALDQIKLIDRRPTRSGRSAGVYSFKGEQS